MTLEEASKRFGVDLDKLKNYEKNGLLTPIEILSSGEKQYTEEEVRKIGVIGSLLKAGLAYEDIRQYLSQSNSGTENTEEILRILRQHRYNLLENIHEKQRLLDEIDYLIDDMRKKFCKGKRKDWKIQNRRIVRFGFLCLNNKRKLYFYMFYRELRKN